MHYMDGAQPFFYRGGGIGCIITHGFMASPAEVRWLGDHLGRAGLSVLGVRVAGHGTHYRDMKRSRWNDWYASVLDAYYIMRAQCDLVFAIGHSMGGVLSLLLASDERTKIDGVVVLSSPFLLPKSVAQRAALTKAIIPYTDQTDRTDLPDVIRAEQARRGEPQVGRVRYDKWATAAVPQFFALVAETDKRLSQVTAPLLLVYAKGDDLALPPNMDYIAGKVGSKHIEKHLLDVGGHIITQDAAREDTFDLVREFVQRVGVQLASGQVPTVKQKFSTQS